MIREIKFGDSSIKVVQPPSFFTPKIEATVFLAGSIEMGKAENWQERFIQELGNKRKHGCSGKSRFLTVYNPRRDDWDNSSVQSIENPSFFQQVMWEMSYLERADVRVFYFAPETISPVSMLEYGKFYSLPNTYLCIHPDYQRAGNLEIFSHIHKIPVYKNFDEIISKILSL